MNYPKTTKLLSLVVLLLCSVQLVAQNQTYTGIVTDDKGTPIIGAIIVGVDTQIAVPTEIDGTFTIEAPQGTVIEVHFIGYSLETRTLGTETNLSITLSEGEVLEEIALLGSRGRPRTLVESPVAVDVISVKELATTTSKTNIGNILTFATPSFNTSQQTVSDATAHMNPSELRNLGPSRTLVLINGKRKNQSALIYINDTPGKGEVGVDLQSIPSTAIERIEVLRDGAAAQYGSDAIAGVINIQLREDTDKTHIRAESGIYTTNTQGLNYSVDINRGFKLGEQGFVNVTSEFKSQDRTHIAGDVDGEVFWSTILELPQAAPKDPKGEDWLFTPQFRADYDQYVKDNPDLGGLVGKPKMTTADVYINSMYALSESLNLYLSGGYVFRQTESYALHRFPAFAALYASEEVLQGLFGKNSFQPTFESNIHDINFSTGLKFNSLTLNHDLSVTYGSNAMDYSVSETFNAGHGKDSPTKFDVGGNAFAQTVVNYDVTMNLIPNTTLAAGIEFRNERYQIIAGEDASWNNKPNSSNPGGGSISFPGNQKQNALDKSRNNIGGYVDLSLDLTDALMIGGAARLERYSDFGSNASWKVNGIYKLFDSKINLRGSVSTGFRAPSLHQQYFTNIQTKLSDGKISNSGTFNKDSKVLRDLKIEELKPEISFNYSVGITAKPLNNLSITADWYTIDVADRILYTGDIRSKEQSIANVLTANNITSFKFFVNAADTRTTGLDLVVNYNRIEVGPGKLALSLAANYNETKLDGNINTPAKLQAANVTIFDRREQGRITTARPRTKVVAGATYAVDALTVNAGLTRFGEVIWKANNPQFDQTYTPKFVTDLSLAYKLNDQLTLSTGVDNLFNVRPDTVDQSYTEGNYHPGSDLGGYFLYAWEVNQFDYNGARAWAKLVLNF